MSWATMGWLVCFFEELACEQSIIIFSGILLLTRSAHVAFHVLAPVVSLCAFKLLVYAALSY